MEVQTVEEVRKEAQLGDPRKGFTRFQRHYQKMMQRRSSVRGFRPVVDEVWELFFGTGFEDGF